MLNCSKLVAFIATSMPEESKRFYCQGLGLTLIEETPFAIVFESSQTTIRIQKTDKVQPPPYTTLGWEVDDIDAVVEALSGSGIAFEQFAGLEQNERGIWLSPGGSKVAWLKDPDRNLLSLTQTT